MTTAKGKVELDTEEYLQKHLREKISMDLRNQKEAEEMNKIRNTSAEKESLQNRRHFRQPSVLCAICKRDTDRKQVVPVGRGNTQCKHVNIMDGSKKKSLCTLAKNKDSLLAKIKLMTSEQMRILKNDLFNQEVECLKRRVGQVECTETHKEVVTASVQKVSEVEKEVNAILAVQEETSSTVPVPPVGDAETDTPVGINASLETKE